MSSSLSREFIQERDFRIFQMRKSGVSVQEIAKRVGVSTAAANQAINRTLNKLSAEALMAYPQVLQMELERMDSLLASVWPLTQHRQVKLDDGTVIITEPDVKFVQRAQELIKDRIKLLGLETTTVNINTGPEPIRHTIPAVAEATTSAVHDPESEAKALYQVMLEAGILTEQLAIGAGDGEE